MFDYCSMNFLVEFDGNLKCLFQKEKCKEDS